jgi:hypothetical protein
MGENPTPVQALGTSVTSLPALIRRFGRVFAARRQSCGSDRAESDMSRAYETRSLHFANCYTGYRLGKWLGEIMKNDSENKRKKGIIHVLALLTAGVLCLGYRFLYDGLIGIYLAGYICLAYAAISAIKIVMIKSKRDE